MPWSEVSSGRWQTPISEYESFLKLLGDSGHPVKRENWAINAVASFSPVGALAQEDLSHIFL